MKLTLFGASGRMGRTVVRLACQAPDVSLVGAASSPASEALGRDVGELAGAGQLGVEVSADLSSALLGAEVLIDFSTAAAFGGMLRAAAAANVAVVSGTTLLSAADHALIERLSAKIPILWAPNMSVGVQLLADLIERAIAALGSDYDVEVVETHHNRKIDAPSGTASMLVERAQLARRGLRPVHGREGQVGARERDEIGVHAVRGGGVVGDHCVHLIGEHDRIEISHRAITRELFAAGALRAARFVAAKPPSVYRLADVLA